MKKSIKDSYNTVISYVRFSSSIQELGDSLKRQKNSAIAFCEKHNLVLSNIKYSDLGRSGFKGDNLKADGGLRAFIDAVENDPEGHKFPKGQTLLLLDEWSRFSRLPPMQAQGIVSQILSLGIDICTCDTEDILSNDADIGTMLTAIIKMNSAYEESARKSKHIKSVWMNKKKALLENPDKACKLTSRCPSWLYLDKDKNEFIPIPERVETVKLIYKLYINGLGKTAIAKYLNKEEIETFGDSNKSARKATMWRESSINKIISETYGRSTLGELQLYEMVGGKRVPTGDVIKGYYPQIISDSDFYQVQAIRKSRITTATGRKGSRLTNLFQGLTRCSKCSSPMVIVNKGKRSSGANLVCSKAKVKAGCEYVAWHYEFVEKSILVTLLNLDYSTLLGLNGTNENSDALRKALVSLQGQLADNKHQIENITNAISQIGLNENLIKKLSFLEAEQLTLESKITTSELELASLSKQHHTKQSVWQTLEQVLNDTQDSTRTDEDIYSKRSKLSMFLKQNIKEIQFSDILIPMTKSLTKQGFGKGSHLRKMIITITLKSGIHQFIIGFSRPRSGIQVLQSLVEDSDNSTCSVYTERKNGKIVYRVIQIASSLENMKYDPEKAASQGQQKYYKSQIDILLNPKEFSIGIDNE
jgi:DNA invertase Pin-like site-specific DNA recombinase/cell division protein FtsB